MRGRHQTEQVCTRQDHVKVAVERNQLVEVTEAEVKVKQSVSDGFYLGLIVKMLFREWPGLQLCTTVQCLHIPPCSIWSKNSRNLSPSRRNYRSSGNCCARRGAELPCYCGRLVRTCWFWHLLRSCDTRSFSSPFAMPSCSVITYSITQVHLLPVPFSCL